ncbi:MAG: hypothetical protein ACTHJN_14060 [Ginsengibacter sp.]
MESIREIVFPENNKIELTIPDNFIGKKIEVIAFELEDSYVEQSKKIKQEFIVAEAKVEGYKFNREEANER